MNESQLHKHIYARSKALTLGQGHTLIAGPGDDCAVYQTPSGDIQLITVDQLVEGVHFERGQIHTSEHIDRIARKAVARSVSDIAAMGGVPVWSLATAVLPKGYQHADELFDAMHKWANHWNCPLIGGDIAYHTFSSLPLTLSVTSAGSMPKKPQTVSVTGDSSVGGGAVGGVGGVSGGGDSAVSGGRDTQVIQPVMRSGAKPGDHLYITGQIGGSYESNWHFLFEPRLTTGQWAATNQGVGRVHAMMDLSDGLGRDSDRIAVASGIIIEIDAAKLPISHHITDANNNWKQAVSEGEDYELLMCFDPDADIKSLTPRPPHPELISDAIGVCRACKPNETPGAYITDPQGNRHAAESLGWDHE